MSVHDTLLAVSGVLGGSGSGGGSATLITKSVTQNGTYNASSDNADGYSKVTVDVPNTYEALDEGKVVKNGDLVPQITSLVDRNSVVDTTTINQLTVAVPNTYDAEDEGKVLQNGELVPQIISLFDTNGVFDTTKIRQITVAVSGGGSADPNAVARSILNRTITSFEDEQLLEIGQYAFSNCTSLVSFKCHNVKKVYMYAFSACLALQSIALPNVTSPVGMNAFQSCSNLETIDLGPSANIAQGMFSADSKLTTIILRSTTITPLGVSVFTATPFASGKAGGTIYIPKVLYDHLGDGTSLDYKSATNWSTVDGYGTITWAQIEGSYYETHYGDDTLIPTT